jgi:hypothetical protein
MSTSEVEATHELPPAVKEVSATGDLQEVKALFD